MDPERAQHFARGRLDLELFLGLAGSFRGHYLMEPPDGTGYRRAYRDDQHAFEVAEEAIELLSAAVEDDEVDGED